MSERTVPEQLTLLPPSPLPLQFRLDARTRRLGLQQIDAIRAAMANRRTTSTDTSRPAADDIAA
jgi:hypothetical protein